MNRVYLLLRENCQTGPFTFDELLQQQLQASDLIWVEGKSVAWAHPYEIDDLKKSLTGPTVEPISLTAVAPVAIKPEKPETITPVVKQDQNIEALIPLTPPKKPKDEIEQRAEELRKKAMAFSHQHTHNHTPVLQAVDDFRPYLNEKDSVHFVHHRRDRHAPVGEILVAAMMLGLIVLGWYGGANKYFFNRTAPATNTVATQLVASDMHAAAGPAKPVAKQDSVNTTDSTVFNNTEYSAMAMTSTGIPRRNNSFKPDTQNLVNNTTTQVENFSDPATQTETEKSVVTEKKQADPVEEKETEKTEKKISSEAKKDTEVKSETKKDNSANTASSDEDEKKKSIGDVLKGIFKKKKKD